MLALKDIREWVAGLGIAENDHVYIGKLDNKMPKSMGVYSRATSGQPNTALGGLAYTTYAVRPVSLLIHWTRNKAESELAAYELFGKLRNVSSQIIGNTQVRFLRLMVPEPQDVGTDDGGVYEYVIWLDFIYQRKEETENG